MRRRWMQPRSSLVGARYDVQQGPPIFTAVCEHLGLASHHARAFWRALSAAQWSVAGTWREELLKCLPSHPDCPAFLAERCTPHVVVEMLEHLAREGVLQRATATEIQEQVLSQLDGVGAWTGARR
jgi:hypothetical protein